MEVQAGSSSTAGTVLAIPVFNSLNKETRKTDIQQIHYMFNHVLQWQNSWQALPWALQQWGLICQKFRWCLTSQTSQRVWYFQKQLSEKRRWFTDHFNRCSLNSGHFFTMMKLRTLFIVTPVSQDLRKEKWEVLMSFLLSWVKCLIVKTDRPARS